MGCGKHWYNSIGTWHEYLLYLLPGLYRIDISYYISISINGKRITRYSLNPGFQFFYAEAGKSYYIKYIPASDDWGFGIVEYDSSLPDPPYFDTRFPGLNTCYDHWKEFEPTVYPVPSPGEWQLIK